MNTKFLIVLVCSVLGIQALHCSDAGTGGAGGAEELSPSNQQLFAALVRPTVTVEEVQKLLARGAKLDVIEVFGRTPLHRAACSRTLQVFDIVKLFLDQGADVNAIDLSGRTPLHRVVSRSSSQATAIVELLLVRGAKLDERDMCGRTPLHYAAHGHLNLDGIRGYDQHAPAIITFLVASGADVNAIDNDGQTPLDLAIHADNPEIIALFITAIAQQRRWSLLRSGWFAAVAAGVYPASGGGGSAGAGDAGL